MDVSCAPQVRSSALVHVVKGCMLVMCFTVIVPLTFLSEDINMLLHVCSRETCGKRASRERIKLAAFWGMWLPACSCAASLSRSASTWVGINWGAPKHLHADTLMLRITHGQRKR